MFAQSRFVLGILAALMLVVGLPAAALAADADPPAPSVVVGEATDVTGTAATLHAQVDTNGTPTTGYFVYGTTPDRLTQRTPEVDLGSTGTVPLTATVTGLAAKTTYYYNAIVENDDWFANGDGKTFVTLSPPETVAGTTTDITYKSATLHIGVATHGQPITISGRVGTGRVLGPHGIVGPFSVTATFGPIAVAADGDVAIPLPALAAGTSYVWAATASGPGGQSPSVGEFRTESLIYMPPPRVSEKKVAYGTHVAITGSISKPARVLTLVEQASPFTGVITPLLGTVATTDATGAYAFDLRAEHSARYGVTTDGAAESTAGNLTKVEVFPVVTAKLQRAKGHRFVVSGRYQPAVDGKVTLFRRDAGRVGTALTSKGTFRFAARALRPGRYEVRVTPAPVAGLLMGKSATVVVPKR
ncbi:MAG TPA: hypothetical protein VFG42_02730 [Baekduia sp.]|uniref:hypothetical protein n=1 Tax=Baekduia sp. TaxID=2600305 RepID=UPI002D76A1A0|nr:hypothetical protein [Baekduia sp.]HET6505683.1 hypothetical protein [Baekduia sp.]